jgi:hypothetical protein
MVANVYTSALESVKRDLELMEECNRIFSEPGLRKHYVEAKWEKATYVAYCESIVPLLRNPFYDEMASLRDLQLSLFALSSILEKGDLYDHTVGRIRELLRGLREEAESRGVTPNLYEIEDFFSQDVQSTIKRELAQCDNGSDEAVP